MPQRKTLNRALLIVTPKQPFYDWVDEVFAGREVDVMDECWSGLIDQDWEIKELERFLKANYAMIFEDLLAGMCSFPEFWPEHRSWILFNQWFDWHYSSMVWDFLPDKRIRREAY